MDVDKTAFQPRLLTILESIAEAEFVSFDLELSGVPVKQPGDAGKPSLQKRYLETKEAAEKYQILQIGLTCVTLDHALGIYVCKPFNFNISPVIEEKRLDIDRTFSFHSGAVEFLLSVGFRMELPFTSGVPYLSRSEAKLAEEKAATRNDRSAIADIQIGPEDVQSIAFLRRVRAEVNAWTRAKHPSESSVLITPIDENGRSVHDVELSRFERRLVHQLVRAEYPTLITVPFRGMIRVQKLDQQREDRINAERLKEAKDRIDKQSGFRWVIEALAGNPPYNMDVKRFATNPRTGEAIHADLDDLKYRYHRTQRVLKNKKSVLIGHNLFLDLIYVYKTFIGPLPDKVEDFNALLHEMFPMIIDTKYMATHNCGDINPRSSLEEIADQLSLQQKPLVETHKDYDKYQGTTAFHEAGYDSLLTAQVAVRLSTKLEAAGTYVDDISEPTSPDEAGGVKLNGAAVDFTPGDQHPPARTVPYFGSAIGGLKDIVTAPLKALTGESGTGLLQKPAVFSHNETTAAASSVEEKAGNTVATNIPAENKGKKKKKPPHAKRKQPEPSPIAPPGRFAHATVFDQLQEDTAQEESEEEEILQFDELPSSNATSSAPVVADTDGVSNGIVKPEDWDTPYWIRQGGRPMPGFDSDFWSVYGNKLRVFGTQEGVCILDQ